MPPRTKEPDLDDGLVPLVGQIDDIEAALSAARAQGLIIVANLPFTRLETVVGHCFRVGAAVSVLPATLKAISGTQLEVRREAPSGRFCGCGRSGWMFRS